MAPVLVQLTPLILGAMLAPVWIIIVLLFLTSPQGLQKATAFVLGMTLARLLQGLLFGFVFGASPDNVAASDGSSPVVSTLLLVIGILLLVAAYFKWNKEADLDGPPPKWMQSVEQAPPLKALALGALFIGVGIKLWVFTLSAISIISAAKLGQTGSIVAYLVYIVLAQSVLLLAILIYALVPKAATLLKQALDWLTRYNQPISVAVALIFGVYFTYSGIKGLLG